MPLWVVFVPAGKHHTRSFHDHCHSELVIVLGGSGEHLLNGKAVSISAGDVLLIHPENVHAYDKTSDLELVNILYDAEKLYLPVADGYVLPLFRKIFPEDKADSLCTAAPLIHLEKEVLEQVSSLIKELDSELRKNHSASGLLSLALLMQLIVKLGRAGGEVSISSEPPTRIGESIVYLNTHYSNRILIDELAHLVHMSKRNFFLLFKQTAGCTPIQYLLRVRTMHAARLLTDSQLSIADIAEKCGFSDSNYFCRKFRENTGLSPRQFRKNGKFAGPVI